MRVRLLLLVLGLLAPLTSHALQCFVAGATLTLTDALCSTYEVRAQLTGVPNFRIGIIESPDARETISDSIEANNAGRSVSASAQVQTDYGIHRLSVSSFTNAPPTALSVTGYGAALSMFQDAVFISSNIGDSFTMSGHIHAFWLGTGQKGGPEEHAYSYLLSFGLPTGLQQNNQPFGSDAFYRIDQDTPQLMEDHTLINWSVTFTLTQESASFLLVSRLDAAAGENRQVDMLQTASIDRIVASNDDMSIWSSSGALKGDNGVFTYAAVTSQVPEPATLALFALALAGLGFSRRRRLAN